MIVDKKSPEALNVSGFCYEWGKLVENLWAMWENLWTACAKQGKNNRPKSVQTRRS